MTLPTERATPVIAPPHLELLGAPELRPFENALAETAARWKADVARHTERRQKDRRQSERTVFTDQHLSIDEDAARD